MNKKTCHWDNKQIRPEIPDAEDQRPSSETLSSDTPWQDGSGPEVKQTDVFQRPTGPRSASSTQTAAVSPLGQAEITTRSPQESTQVTNELRLAQLDKETQKLRRLLGLEASRTSQGTMTTSDLVPDQLDELQAAAAAAVVRTGREVGCQTDAAEVCSHVVSTLIQVH